MNPSEKAIRDRAGYDPRFEMMMRRTPNKPRAQKPSKEKEISPADAGSLAIRDFYGEAPGFEKVTGAGLIGDYGSAGYNLVRASLKHIPVVGNILNIIDTVKDAGRLTGCILTDGFRSQATFKAAVDLTAHALGSIGWSAGAFYDQSKAIGDFFDAGANTVNYFRGAPKMRAPPAWQAVSGLFGLVTIAPVITRAVFAAALIPGTTTAGLMAAATSSLVGITAFHTTLGAIWQSVWSAIKENRQQLPRAAPLSA